MFRRILFLSITALLLFSFWLHPDILTITAGISLFLFGMLCLEQGFRQVSSGVLARHLRSVTRSRFGSFVTGTLATGILQSSSMISVVAVSFVSTGLIALIPGMAMVIGSGLGSTFGIWLMAALGMKLAISHYAMPLLVLGTLLQLRASQRTRGSGYVLLGLGFLLLGIHYIRQGMAASGDLALLTDSNSLAVGVLAGILLTLLMQSSQALLVLVIAAMANGHIDYLQALALCIGTNIGTTATALVASISATEDGRRLAIANVIYKLAAALIFLPAMPFWAGVTSNLAQWLGFANQPMLQLALFHTLFNCVGAVLVMPLLTPLQRGLLLIVKQHQPEPKTLDIPLPERQQARARLLTTTAMAHPDAALIALRTESARLYRRAVALIGFGLYISDNSLLDTDAKGYSQQPETIPPWPNWRVGKLYKLQIRGIYDDITRFCDQLEPQATQEQKESIAAIRIACANFVAAIKQLRLLHKSLRRHIRSETEVHQHYWLLRARIVTSLRRIRQLSIDKDSDIIDAVRILKQDIFHQDLFTGGSLSQLLEQKKTSPLHTTSLINDNGIAHNICNALIDGAVILMLQGQEAIIHHNHPDTKAGKTTPLWSHSSQS